MHLDSYFDAEGPGGAVGIARDGEDAFLDVIGFGDIDARSRIASLSSSSPTTNMPRSRASPSVR